MIEVPVNGGLTGIVRVALDVPIHTLFDYMADEPVAPGQRVVVPLGRRQMIGVVMESVATSDLPHRRIKNVLRVLDDSEPLSAGLLELLKFCSDYYHYPIGPTVISALPTRLRSDKPLAVKRDIRYRLIRDEADSLPRRKSVARRIVEKLAAHPCSLAQIRALSATAGAQLKWLEQEGWVGQCEMSGELPAPPVQLVNAHSLTMEQQQAVDAVTQSSNFGCFLLHGITGSGKTEVYVHLMHCMLQPCPELGRMGGGQILLLVPEINLTPQLEGYFHSRFPDVPLVSLHSGLSENQRLDHWQQAQTGYARIVLGTRLSVFAELPRLSLIIVDEEHDSSFKQQDGLRYSARDVAVFRASQVGIPIVLGSATPSLESYHNAQIGRYRLLKLSGRAKADARLPEVSCININQSVMTEGVSEKLMREIVLRISRGEQSLLFINRRGYAPVLMCTECGWVSDCRNCAGRMVLHLAYRKLRCHHCGFQLNMPTSCPDCGHAGLHPVGSGTQRVESLLQTRFPGARILRVDRDSTRNKRSWKKMREQIHANEVDILVGTQMLAKGHDFPALTLVGVLGADSALYSADFRAAERLFAQLMQVAGRAGRADKAGCVLIQTAFPDHPLFRCLERHDFDEWASQLLAERRMAGFPPFVFQAMLRAEGKSESDVYAYLGRARAAAIELKHEVEVFGVVPASLARRANHVRAQLLIQAESRKILQQFLRDWRIDEIPAPRLHCSLDIDPQEF